MQGNEHPGQFLFFLFFFWVWGLLACGFSDFASFKAVKFFLFCFWGGGAALEYMLVSSSLSQKAPPAPLNY